MVLLCYCVINKFYFSENITKIATSPPRALFINKNVHRACFYEQIIKEVSKYRPQALFIKQVDKKSSMELKLNKCN